MAKRKKRRIKQKKFTPAQLAEMAERERIATLYSGGRTQAAVRQFHTGIANAAVPDGATGITRHPTRTYPKVASLGRTHESGRGTHGVNEVCRPHVTKHWQADRDTLARTNPQYGSVVNETIYVLDKTQLKQLREVVNLLHRVEVSQNKVSDTLTRCMVIDRGDWMQVTEDRSEADFIIYRKPGSTRSRIMRVRDRDGSLIPTVRPKK